MPQKMKIWSKKNIPLVCLGFVAVILLAGILGFLSSKTAGIIILFLMLFSAIYRPLIGITLLVMSQILDIFNVFGLRIYHWAVIFLIISLILNYFNFIKNKTDKKTKAKVGLFKILKNFSLALSIRLYILFRENRYFVILLSLLIISSIIAIANSPDPLFSAKQTVALIFSIAICYVTYYWIRVKKYGQKQVLLAFIYSSIPVCVLAIYQNLAQELGFKSFQIMTARPNAAFFEPDWLGIYTVLIIGFIFPLLFLKLYKKKLRFDKEFAKITALSLLNLIVLIISVARASWVALIAGIIIIFSWIALLKLSGRIGSKIFKKFSLTIILFAGLFIVSIILIKSLSLSRFNLWDRFESIYKGQHIITMAEKDGVNKKIDLEEIEKYKAMGYRIYEDKTKDENIQSRFRAYDTNLELVKENWLLGRGQGSIMVKRDYLHNANNIFFEWWISSGLLGLTAFILMLAAPLIKILKTLKNKKKLGANTLFYQFTVLLGIGAIIITNLFNSAIFFIPMWIYIGFIYAIKEKL
ncbi:MAG: hypothetical protein GF335_01385 [Candidatus Moranbacteria bacterium]|nr:hypothetical protein [Candidatus Moranbacteria bacterium]